MTDPAETAETTVVPVDEFAPDYVQPDQDWGNGRGKDVIRTEIIEVASDVVVP